MDTTFELLQLPDGHPYVAVAGDLDIGSAPHFQRAIADLSARHARLIVSLEHCTYLDSSALNVLAKAQKDEREPAAVIVIVPAENRIRRVLAVSGLETVFAVVPDVQAAQGLLAPLERGA